MVSVSVLPICTDAAFGQCDCMCDLHMLCILFGPSPNATGPVVCTLVGDGSLLVPGHVYMYLDIIVCASYKGLGGLGGELKGNVYHR